jgi:hypothetical protein
MQKVNRLTIPERRIPTPDEVADRITRRLEVQLEHEHRHLSERERKTREEDLLPIIDRLIITEPGRRHLATVLFSYLRDRSKPPSDAEKNVTAPDPGFQPRTGRRRPRRRPQKSS